MVAGVKAQEEGTKISTYAGQAAAGLTAAGKPLTPENMKAMIDELAKKDKPAGRRSRAEAAIEDLYNDDVEADDAPLDFGVGDFDLGDAIRS